MRGLATHLTLRSGVSNLAELQAQVAGGRLRGSTSLSTTPACSVARWQADLRFIGVQVEQWLRRLQARSTPFLGGRMAARLQVQGVGNSTATILANLQGRVAASLGHVTVSHLIVEWAGLDVAQALGVYVRGDDPLPLNCANVQANIFDVSEVQQSGNQLRHQAIGTPCLRATINGAPSSTTAINFDAGRLNSGAESGLPKRLHNLVALTTR